MNPLMYIKEHMNQLTKQEQRVANYVIEYPSEVVLLNAKEIGDKTNTSSATVIRMIKKLDYKGLSDFKVNISRYIPEEEVNIFKRIEKEETIESLKNKLFSRAQYSMEMSSKSIEEDEVEQLVNAIEQSKVIIVYGIGASYLVAQDIYQKFLRLGLNIQCTLDTHLIAATIGSFKEDSLFIGITSGGNNTEVQRLITLSKRYNGKSCCITSDQESELLVQSDYQIIHDASTEESLRYAATSSLIAQLYTIDIIFYAYLVRHYEDNKRKINDTKEAVSQFKL